MINACLIVSATFSERSPCQLRFNQVRGDLVNLCIPGDVLRVVGIVKALQVREGRGIETHTFHSHYADEAIHLYRWLCDMLL